jgi:hypothetical protein
MGRYLAPSSSGLRQPTDPKKENGQVVNPPRYVELGGLDKASKTSVMVSKSINKTNAYKVVKPGKGSAR